MLHLHYLPPLVVFSKRMNTKNKWLNQQIHKKCKNKHHKKAKPGIRIKRYKSLPKTTKYIISSLHFGYSKVKRRYSTRTLVSAWNPIYSQLSSFNAQTKLLEYLNNSMHNPYLTVKNVKINSNYQLIFYTNYSGPYYCNEIIHLNFSEINQIIHKLKHSNDTVQWWNKMINIVVCDDGLNIIINGKSHNMKWNQIRADIKDVRYRLHRADILDININDTEKLSILLQYKSVNGTVKRQWIDVSSNKYILNQLTVQKHLYYNIAVYIANYWLNKCKIDDKLDVYNEQYCKWNIGTILDIKYSNYCKSFLIHFDGFLSVYDEWIDINLMQHCKHIIQRLNSKTTYHRYLTSKVKIDVCFGLEHRICRQCKQNCCLCAMDKSAYYFLCTQCQFIKNIETRDQIDFFDADDNRWYKARVVWLRQVTNIPLKFEFMLYLMDKRVWVMKHLVTVNNFHTIRARRANDEYSYYSSTTTILRTEIKYYDIYLDDYLWDLLVIGYFRKLSFFVPNEIQTICLMYAKFIYQEEEIVKEFDSLFINK
eukprot:78821_1